MNKKLVESVTWYVHVIENQFLMTNSFINNKGGFFRGFCIQHFQTLFHECMNKNNMGICTKCYENVRDIIYIQNNNDVIEC